MSFAEAASENYNTTRCEINAQNVFDTEKKKKSESDHSGVDVIEQICLYCCNIKRKQLFCGENCELVLQEWIRPRPRRDERQSLRPQRLATTGGAPPAPETTATDQVGGVSPACGRTI